ncbi:hypothetical protein [Asticcacaulis taihuensis]|uniref:hypothetical protein n=1 Tax=Asticcacaulis taihuensis TaxID=260084 RepID=UPI0026EA1268|nr:hypothetical protein [Asticcacaulis taihuensis]
MRQHLIVSQVIGCSSGATLPLRRVSCVNLKLQRLFIADDFPTGRLSQQDLAQLWGRDQSVIAKIEKCYRRIDLIEFVSLSVIVGLDYVEVARNAESTMRATGAIKS